MSRRYSPTSRSSHSSSSSSCSSLSSPNCRHRGRSPLRSTSNRRAQSRSSYHSDSDREWHRRSPRSTGPHRTYPSSRSRSYRRRHERSLSSEELARSPRRGTLYRRRDYSPTAFDDRTKRSGAKPFKRGSENGRLCERNGSNRAGSDQRRWSSEDSSYSRYSDSDREQKRVRAARHSRRGGSNDSFRRKKFSADRWNQHVLRDDPPYKKARGPYDEYGRRPQYSADYGHRRDDRRHTRRFSDSDEEEKYLNGRSARVDCSDTYHTSRRHRNSSPINQQSRGRAAHPREERYRRKESLSPDNSKGRGRVRESDGGLGGNGQLGSIGRHEPGQGYMDKRDRFDTLASFPDKRVEGKGTWYGARNDQERIDDTPDAGKTRWQKRRQIRESYMGRVNVWDVSPEPPRKLAERFDVGADERKRKERKRKRKEERKVRREAKRAKLMAEHNERSYVVEANAPQLNEAKDELESGSRDNVDDEDEEEEVVIGPTLPNVEREGGSKGVDYGKALRPGEGSKMAAFVQDGARIPRRGEIGLTSDEISAFESQGYVMSGSRNRRMEAVRIRKENQIYSAEELAALSQFSHEERKLREERIMNQFRALVESKVGGSAEAGNTENVEGPDHEPK